MEQGDIVIIPFPFTDLTSSKIRPALIISNQDFNQRRNVMLIAISTKAGESYFSIPLRQTDLAAGILQKESFLRLQNLFTLEKRLVIKKVAQLKPGILNQVVKKVRSFL